MTCRNCLSYNICEDPDKGCSICGAFEKKISLGTILNTREDGSVVEEYFCDCCGQMCGEQHFRKDVFVKYDIIDGKVICEDCLEDNANSL